MQGSISLWNCKYFHEFFTFLNLQFGVFLNSSSNYFFSTFFNFFCNMLSYFSPTFFRCVFRYYFRYFFFGFFLNNCFNNCFSNFCSTIFFEGRYHLKLHNYLGNINSMKPKLTANSEHRSMKLT